MGRMKYHPPEHATLEPRRLIFPAAALDQARRSAPKAAPSAGLQKLSQRMEAELDRMQRSLDSLKDDVQNYRFPTPGTPDARPPRAA